MPCLSVVLPVRDVAPYLADTLTSLAHNCDADTEVIVVDDGSVDATPRILEQFADRFMQLHVITHEVAVGLGDARNVGTAAATGEYVTYLDGDDWLGPDYLRRLTAAVVAADVEFLRVDHVQVRGRARAVHRAPEARRGVALDPRSGIAPMHRRTMVDYPYAWAGIYRRDLGELLHFPGHLHTAEDRPWVWRLHREASSYAVASLTGVFYRRQVAGSLTQIGDERQLHFLDAFTLVLQEVADETPDVQRKAVRQFLAVLAHHVRLQRRFTRPARARMRAGAREILAGIAPDVLAEAMPNDRRADRLRRLLPQREAAA